GQRAVLLVDVDAGRVVVEDLAQADQVALQREHAVLHVRARELDLLLARLIAHDGGDLLELALDRGVLVDAPQPVHATLQVEPERHALLAQPPVTGAVLLGEEARERQVRHQHGDRADQEPAVSQGHDLSPSPLPPGTRVATWLRCSFTRTLGAISTVSTSSVTPVTRAWMPPVVTIESPFSTWDSICFSSLSLRCCGRMNSAQVK